MSLGVEDEDTASMPPTMQRMSAMVVGSCRSWMTRLRRELAVALLEKRFMMRSLSERALTITLGSPLETWVDVQSITRFRRLGEASRRGERPTEERMRDHSR